MKLKVQEGCQKLISYIEKENYKGFDPYDALTSPLFKISFLKDNKLVRFGIQQLVKRSPLNLRPLLLIKKGLNPVSLGLCMQGYTNLGMAGLMKKSEVIEKCDFLLNELTKMIPPGYKGACWGYDFPWEARYGRIPAFQPTIVATGFITNALFQYHKYTQNPEAFELCKSACEFILQDINQTTDSDGTVCFSYSPFDKNQVFNASMKGARTLSQVYGITGESHLCEYASKAVKYVMKHQQPDGSWKYAAANKGEWIDNYHTGYVLDCLDEYIIHCKDSSWNENRRKGFEYYINNFFEKGMIPKFYNHSLYPVDCTSAAQSMLTLCRYGNHQKALEVGHWMVKEMQNKEGYFYFRKYRYFTEKQSFMRWSNAWMFAGLSEVLKFSN